MDKDFKRCRAFTAPELLIVTAVIGILVSVAVPTFVQPLERQRIINAAEIILHDLRWARSEAIKRNTVFTVVFTDGGAGVWRYTTTPTVRTIDSADNKNFLGVAMTPSTTFTADTVSFNPVRGTANAGRVNLSSTNYAMEIRVSVLGRIRICGNIPGYIACP